MKTVNVSGLKNNPGAALRMAHDDMVLVMNQKVPDALMIGLKSAKIIGMPGVHKALATDLFNEGNLSLARSAKLADMPQPISHPRCSMQCNPMTHRTFTA